MPTYRNDSGGRVTFPDKHYLSWDLGESKALPFFVPHKMLGLSMVSEKPYVLRGQARGYGYDEIEVTPGQPMVMDLPYSETVEISVYLFSGWVRMSVGDCPVPITVDSHNNHVSRLPWDMSAYLTFESDETVNIFVKVEPFTEKGV